MSGRFEILGEVELILGIWGTTQYFQGAAEVYFRDLGRAIHYFKGAREQRHPWGLSI